VPTRGAEQPALAVLGDAGRIDVSAQGLDKRVMTRHRMFTKSVTKVLVLTTPAQVAPAAFRHPSRSWKVCSICARMSTLPAQLPSTSRANWPAV
jgi:hypothetical protein